MSKFYQDSEWESERFGKVKIIKKVSSTHSKVVFLDIGVEKVFRNDSISSGKMSHEEYYIGSLWKTSNFGEVEVLGIIKDSRIKVEIIFKDTGTIKIISPKDLKTGKIKDEYSKKGYWGMGCLGKASIRRPCGKNKRSYNIWHSMLKRCYDWQNNCKAYKNVSVCEEWLCYENFEKWFDCNYKEGFELDKDYTKLGNNLYCPEFCSFIPHRLNGMLSPDPDKKSKLPVGVFNSHCKAKPYRARCYSLEEGKNVCLGYYSTPEEAFSVYKAYKSVLVKSLADYYYEKGCISEAVHTNLTHPDIISTFNLQPSDT